jgi:hypothetical protein
MCWVLESPTGMSPFIAFGTIVMNNSIATLDTFDELGRPTLTREEWMEEFDLATSAAKLALPILKARATGAEAALLQVEEEAMEILGI